MRGDVNASHCRGEHNNPSVPCQCHWPKSCPMRRITAHSACPHCADTSLPLESRLSFPEYSESAASALSCSEKRGFMQSLGNTSFRTCWPEVGSLPRSGDQILSRPQRYPCPP